MYHDDEGRTEAMMGMPDMVGGRTDELGKTRKRQRRTIPRPIVLIRR